nr:MAG TPA: hypothetical protein [Caudoviricetes sp.]
MKVQKAPFWPAVFLLANGLMSLKQNISTSNLE